HRLDRTGYKAGALEAGLKVARGEFVGIFDADFIPTADFLTQLIPHFRDPKVGMVQARWGHINQDYSLLTKIQAILLDGHFILEPAKFSYILMCILSILMFRSMVIRYNMGWYEMILIDVPLFFAATFSFCNFYMVCQRELHKDWLSRFKYVPFLMSVGIGLSI